MSTKENRYSRVLDAVAQAMEVTENVGAELVEGHTLEKGDRSPVTVADFASQALLVHRLKTIFPTDGIVAEESLEEFAQAGNYPFREQVVHFINTVDEFCTEEVVREALGASDNEGPLPKRYWVIDPIDGTKGFLRGDQYAIAVALVVDGQVEFGVLGCPRLKVGNDRHGGIAYAIHGRGAFWRPSSTGKLHRLEVNGELNPSQARFVESVESGHSSHSASQEIANILGTECSPVRIDSQCKYVAVASGEANLYLRLPTSADYVEKVWDHAAGSLIVEEAGGCVTDATGMPLNFTGGAFLEGNQGVVASSGAFHDAVIEAVAEVQTTQNL